MTSKNGTTAKAMEVRKIMYSQAVGGIDTNVGSASMNFIGLMGMIQIPSSLRIMKPSTIWKGSWLLNAQANIPV